MLRQYSTTNNNGKNSQQGWQCHGGPRQEQTNPYKHLQGPAPVTIVDPMLDNTVPYNVDNALKLYGDQYLARVHRAAGESCGFADWHQSVQRKLETLERVHEKVHGEAADLRMETLEWIVILLIAGEIALSLGGLFAH